MKRKKILFFVLSILIVLIVVKGLMIKNQVKTQVKELFKMNKTLQEEGYYMAEFEFRMLGISYYLDKGQYKDALNMLSLYHSKLSKKEGLVKIPEFKNNAEETVFYLNLQDPETGAFMSSGAPYFTFWPVTENILNHLEALKDPDSNFVKLKYPLNFLNNINTPEKLVKYLDDLAYIGWLSSKFPQTSFFFVREMMSCAKENNVLERNNLYSFSPAWKNTYIKWMYDFQDEETGMWGPKYRKSKKLVMRDLDNTASILKKFRDSKGNNLYPDFPLRFEDQLFKHTLEILNKPFPDDDDFSNIHEWNLVETKGINMLLRYLWKNASEEYKKQTRKVIANFINLTFEKYYVKEEGAFSYYPNSKHATLDGISNMFLDNVGALSYKKQKTYWGDPAENARDMGIVNVEMISQNDLQAIQDIPEINSYRIYTVKPNFHSLTDSVWAVVYPHNTKVLDIMEVVPNLLNWIENSTLSMGNWKSMAEIKNKYTSINIEKPLIFNNSFPFEEINSKLQDCREIYIMGYDILQIPGFIIKFKKVCNQ